MSDRIKLDVVLTLVTFGFLCPSCNSADRQDEDPTIGEPGKGKPTVGVVNYPLKYFVERVAGDEVDVLFPVPAEVDPAYWKPEAEDVAAYQRADLILLNGASYAKWVDSATLSRSRLVNTSVQFTDRLILIEDAVTHSHGPGAEHGHGSVAFTTWLDPMLAIEHASSVRDALVQLLPDLDTTFNQNLTALRDDLLDLDEKYLELVREYERAPILASHPVYQYFASRYGLNLRSVHWEPSQIPDQKQWRDLDRILGEHPAAWMIWEAPPLDETRARLAERGIQCVVFETCGSEPSGRDYIESMRSNAARLERVFHGPKLRVTP